MSTRTWPGEHLRIYDATGCLVHSVVIPQTAHGNPQTITWNGRDDLGRKLPTGIRKGKSEEGIVKGEYVIRSTSGSKTTDREVLLLK